MHLSGELAHCLELEMRAERDVGVCSRWYTEQEGREGGREGREGGRGGREGGREGGSDKV